jgi:foldase protein PrsA
MKRILTPVLILTATLVLLSGCDSLLTEPTSPLPTLAPDATQPTVLEPTATELPPEAMPTAAPLWTPTNTPEPSATPLPDATPAPTSAVQELDASLVAMVNGVPVSRADFDAQLAQAETYFVQQPGFDPKSEVGQQSLLQLREQVLGWMIDQVLIQQAAAAAGITVPAAKIDAQVLRIKGDDEARFEAWLAANGLTEETMREQVRLDLLTSAMRDRVTATLTRRTQQVHARHILLSTEEGANAALARLQAGANFIALAREVSEDETTRDSGGDLGFMPRGVMPPAFDEAAFALKPGEISGIVRSDFGFHLIQVVEIDPNRAVPDDLWPVVQQRAFDDWLNQQRANANIQRSADVVRG